MAERSQRVGRVVSVQGAKISGILRERHGTEADTSGSAVQIGTVLKMDTGGTNVFGIVSSMRIADPSSESGDVASEHEKRMVEVDLLGEGRLDPENPTGVRFQRGVTRYPALGAGIHSATAEDLSAIYARPNASNVRIGTIYQSDGLPAYVVTDDLLGKHFAVLGTTGAGKSCTVALILRSILLQHPNGHIILLDPHNEYSRAFGDSAEVLNPDNLQLPYWLLNSEEMIEVMIGRNQSDKDTQIAILNSAILAAKKKFLGSGVDTNYVTVDTPTPYNLSELVRNIDAAMGQLDKPESSIPFLRLKARIERLKSDRRFGFMFAGLMVRDTMADVVSRLLRVPVAGKPITIVDLSGVPSEIVDIVVSLLSRIVFDFAVWSEPVQTLPVLLVCEEAHRYVPAGNDTGFEPTKLVLSRIAKEGRKYGVSLCLVTQRPSELSPGILAQCNTLFALRMSNEQDQEFVRKALPEYGLGLMNALPSLDTQEAVVVGEGVTVPMRLRFDHLDEAYRPRSGSASFADIWHRDNVTKDLVTETIERWRHQERAIPMTGDAAFTRVRKDLLPSEEQSEPARPAARTPRAAR
jgi:uncharacterized protein